MPKQPTNRIEVVNKEGNKITLYEAQPHQQVAHECNAPNLLCLGTRATGKSTWLRWDAIIRCLMFPGFMALIIRRTNPDLRKSHLNFIGAEMEMLGGSYNQTLQEARFPNGSKIIFTHCEKQADVMNFLSSEWGFIGFDELSTFPLEMFLLICAAARVSTEKPYKAVVRCSSNPLGPGAAWMKQWFVDHDVNPGDYPDYVPQDFEMQFSTLDDNKYVSRAEYEKRLKTLPPHVRKAWLEGEFVIEGAYFTDFERSKLVNGRKRPWHVIQSMPTWKDQNILDLPWVSIYRALDWGYYPDPAVCLWIALLPNHWEIVFRERVWKRTLARDVAEQIKRESEGMHIVQSFCDPTMFVKTGETSYSIGEQFEQCGVPLTPVQNDRMLYGYAVHEHLNTLVTEGEYEHPQVQILEHACPNLLRTFPILQQDPTDPRKLGDGDDHYVISLAYYCMGEAVPVDDPVQSAVPRWMQPKSRSRDIGFV